MSSKQQLTTRIRNASLSLQSRQVQLTNLIQSNQFTISQQNSLIHQLSSSKTTLHQQKLQLQQQLRVLMEKQHCLSGKMEENMGLKERVGELERMIAREKVWNAVRESEILGQQMEMGRLRGREKEIRGVRERQEILERQEEWNRKRMMSITKTSSRYSDILKMKEKYSDSDRKQWIKILKIQESTREETNNTIKAKSKSLVKGFIPHDLRRLGWSVLIENKLALNENLYCYYHENRQVPEKVRFQIDKDIDRSFPDVSEIQKNFAIELKEIIQIFHCYRPDVSYVQGMTYPAGILLLVLDKYKAWQCFCNLILTTNIVYRMYVFDLQNIALYCRAFDILLEQTQPKLSLILNDMNIHSEIYLIEWFYTMFSRSFCIPTVFKIWDLFLFFGESILYQVGLSIFDQIAGELMELEYQEAIQLIRNFQNRVVEEKILSELSSGKVPVNKLVNAKEKAKERNNVPSVVGKKE